jgi:hypothetical protein
LLRTRRYDDGWRGLKLLGKRRRPRERCCAHNVRLDHNIGRTADHQKVLNIIATDDDQAPPSVHRSRFDYRQPGLARTSARSPGSLGTKGAHQPREESD